MIEATTFPDVEDAVVSSAQPFLAEAMVSNLTPSPIPPKLVTVAAAGGGSRDWGEASVNIGVNIYAATEADCRELAAHTQDVFASISNDLIEGIDVPAGGGTSVPRQTPPFQRYFVATVHLRAQALLDLDLS